MNIRLITDKYLLWEDRKQYVLTNRKRVEIFRGTRQECEAIMKRYPNGITKQDLREVK